MAIPTAIRLKPDEQMPPVTSKTITGQVARGIIGWIRSIFAMSSATTFNVKDVLDEKTESERVERAQRLYDLYHGDVDAIVGYLSEALSRTFSADDIEEFQWLYLPVTRTIVDKLCIVYRGEIDRTLTTDQATAELKEILTSSDINAKSKYWHRMAKLFDTVLVQPVVREIDGEKVLQFDVWTPNKAIVVEREENFLEPERVIISVQSRNADGSFELRNIHWTDKEHFETDAEGHIINDPENPNRENPYAELPFVVLRLRETENFWGDGQTVLANIEEKIAILLVQLMDLLIMQAHGQPVVANAKLEGIVRTGPKYPLVLRSDPASPQAGADFFFAASEGKIDELTSAIDWLIDRTMTMHGLAQSSTMAKSTVASGYAKLIDNWDLIERREEDVEILKTFERKLFRKAAIVMEYHEMATFVESEQLNLDVGDYTFPEDPIVEYKAKKMRMDLGLWTPVDDLMKQDRTLTREEAIKRLRDNLQLRNELNDQYGLVTSAVLFNDPKPPEPGDMTPEPTP
jgi:hypothetical protein